MKRRLTSLNTYGIDEARAIANALNTYGIPASVENLQVNGHETSWFHVYVPTKKLALASVFAAGFRAGCDSGRVEMRSALQGETIEQARLACGVRS